MIGLSDANPIATFLWLMTAAGIAMFCLNPLVLALSLAGALFFFYMRNPDAGLKAILPYLCLALASALLNPLFVHNGATVLFVLNHNPVTLEAFYYGLALGAMLISVLCWFRCFQQIMTTDKLLYIFGSALPKLTLILSIALRYIPLLRDQAKRVRDSQKALGLFREENLVDRLRGEMRIFSVLVTWALENGVITADSMSARGYGVGRRTRFALFRFRRRDAILCAVCLLLGGIAIAGAGTGALTFRFYPRCAAAQNNPFATISCISYGLLALLPGLFEVEEHIRWNTLKSKI